ncbi:MAG: hypothetical protein JXR37_08950 [Kiritimatiellae bacterium]|nr:hypothetical protein [Kiritimatiellia bacterium]
MRSTIWLGWVPCVLVSLLLVASPAMLAADDAPPATGTEAPGETPEDPGDAEPGPSPEELQKQFGDDAELAAQLLAQGYELGRIKQALDLAETSEALSAEDILKLLEKASWGKVRKAVKLDAGTDLTAEKLLELRQDYGWGWITRAMKLSDQSGVGVEEILQMRKEMRWSKVRKELAAKVPDQTPDGTLEPDALAGTVDDKTERKADQLADQAEKKAEKAAEKAERQTERQREKAEREERKAGKKAEKQGGKKDD